eukprot:6542985-Alexandrium_andersonii.AAC.1
MRWVTLARGALAPRAPAPAPAREHASRASSPVRICTCPRSACVLVCARSTDMCVSCARVPAN